MKKYIAMFSVLALALLLGGPVLANSWTSSGSDDFIVTQERNYEREFKVEHNAVADIDNTLIINSNSGGNFVAAGGDIEDGMITSGDADVDSNEMSDVNSLTVTDECCELDSGDANSGNSTSDDDFILTQEDKSEDEWKVETDTYVDDLTYSEVNANTGGNFAAAGEDVEEDFEGITSGDSKVDYDRTLWRNYIKVERLKN